ESGATDGGAAALRVPVEHRVKFWVITEADRFSCRRRVAGRENGRTPPEGPPSALREISDERAKRHSERLGEHRHGVQGGVAEAVLEKTHVVAGQPGAVRELALRDAGELAPLPKATAELPAEVELRQALGG